MKADCARWTSAKLGAVAGLTAVQSSTTGRVAPAEESAPPASAAALRVKVLPATTAKEQLETACPARAAESGHHTGNVEVLL